MKIIDRRDIPVPSSETAGVENPAYRGMGNPVNGYAGGSVEKPALSVKPIGVTPYGAEASKGCHGG